MSVQQGKSPCTTQTDAQRYPTGTGAACLPENAIPKQKDWFPGVPYDTQAGSDYQDRSVHPHPATDGPQKPIVQNKTYMDTTSDISFQTQSPKRLPESQRSTYQFPVYRWINWLVIAGYGVGLALMFLLASLVGLPAPIVWPFLVFVFCAGVALLGRPKALLAVMMFYFLLMPGNRLFGLLGLPVPGFIDELFFVPPIAIIVMHSIQKRHVEGGVWFAYIWLGFAALSWYVNGKPSLFGSIRVTLIMMKFYILWYFCRLACTFEDIRQFWKWGEFYIHYAAAQFLYNCLWQRAPWVTLHEDNSGGVFGPEGVGAAHIVGYISCLALFLLAAWWIGVGHRASKGKRCWMLFLGAVITYDLVFMTDTKHALLMVPFAFLPVLFHRGVPFRLRLSLLAGGGVVALCAMFYLGVFSGRFHPGRQFNAMMASPKGDAFIAVTRDVPLLVHYPLFGAGPGRFLSPQAVDARTPLAKRYVTPYVDEQARRRLIHGGTSRTGDSVLGLPQSDFLTLMGDFGWLGTAVYAAFMAMVVFSLWKKANLAREKHPEYGAVCLALGAGVVFISLVMLFAQLGTAGCVVYPWWMMVGRTWDMSFPGETEELELPADGREQHDGQAGMVPVSHVA